MIHSLRTDVPIGGDGRSASYHGSTQPYNGKTRLQGNRRSSESSSVDLNPQLEHDVQVHHHVHHHLHHHHHRFDNTVLREVDEEEEGEEDDLQLRALWEPNFPPLSKHFFSGQRASETLQSAQANDYFRVQKVISAGFNSIVMEAVMRQSKQIVCIKMVRKNCSDEKRKKLLMEQKVLFDYSRASHFIVHLLSSFQTKLHCYLVFEHLDGDSLESRLRSAVTFSEKVAMFYVAEIALALFYLHRVGVVHRDLTARNVMLRGSGHVVLVDFGNCKADMRNKFTSTQLGSRKDMAPEILNNVPYNKSVDYWAMGILFFTMLHGEMPFQGRTQVAVFKSVTGEKEAYSKCLSEEAVSFCKALLQKNQKYRLGYDEDSEDAVKSQPFFEDVNWDRMQKRLYTPPFIPLSHARDPDAFLTEVAWPGIAAQNAVFDGVDLGPRLSVASLLPKSIEASGETDSIVGELKVEGSTSSVLSAHRMDSKISFIKKGQLTPKRMSVQFIVPEIPAVPATGSKTGRRNTNTYVLCKKESDKSMDSGSSKLRSNSEEDNFVVYKLEEVNPTWKQRVYLFIHNIWTVLVNCCRVQRATCRGVCCGPENVSAPVMKEHLHRPSLNLSYASHQDVHRLSRAQVQYLTAQSHRLSNTLDIPTARELLIRTPQQETQRPGTLSPSFNPVLPSSSPISSVTSQSL